MESIASFMQTYYIKEIIAIISLIAAFLAYSFSKKAKNNSKQVIETFLRQITNFDDIASTVIDEFLTDIEKSEIKISLISPAFSALSNKPEQFELFNTHLQRVGDEDKRNNIKMIIVTEYRLFRWYKDLIKVMDDDNDNKIKLIKDIIERLIKIKDTMHVLLNHNRCKIMKRTITFQIFLLENQSLIKSLQLNMHSDFPTKVPFMINKKNATYTEISNMSNGFYSRAKGIYKDQNEIFDNCWEHENSNQNSCMNKNDINDYFDFVIKRLEKYSSQLNTENIEKKNSK